MSVHPSRQAYVSEEQEVSSAQLASVESPIFTVQARPNAELTVNLWQADGSISLDNIPTDTNYQLPSANGGPSQRASIVLDECARKRRAAALAVPTDDQRVRAVLRARGEPITLFGEKKDDRRERLRGLLLADQEAGGSDDESMADADDDAADGTEGEFYTEGNQDLLAARRDMANYSLPRAAQRLAYQKIESQIPVPTHVRHRKAVKEKLAGVELFGSQIASERAVSIVRFSPNGELVACGDWAGSVKLLDVPNLDTKTILRGHRGVVGGISWVPTATLPSSTVAPEHVNLASSAQDGEIHLWSLTQDTPMASLSGHSARVCRTEFHPSGRYLASASYDFTWRLWDVNTTTELLLQEGHSKEVYAVSFNEDGSLIASAGLDSIGRIWDMRTGRTAMLLESHIAPIHAVDWSSDGKRVMTGSADGFAKCWDLRAVRETASIGAHVGGVADLRWFKGTDGPLSGASPRGDTAMSNGDTEHSSNEDYQPKTSGTFIVSSGFDKAVNIFSADDWALCKSLTGHDGTVLSVDATADSKWIASCGRDRTVKLWARDDMSGI